MGLFDFLFKNRPKPVGKYEGDFKMLDGYRPHFTTFGGSIYEYDGSHGCVNLPYNAAATLYDLVEYDTPVIIFRGAVDA